MRVANGAVAPLYGDGAMTTGRLILTERRHTVGRSGAPFQGEPCRSSTLISRRPPPRQVGAFFVPPSVHGDLYVLAYRQDQAFHETLRHLIAQPLTGLEMSALGH